MKIQKLSWWRMVWRLLGMTRSLLKTLAVAIVAGSLGHIAAIAIPVLGAWSMVQVMNGNQPSLKNLAAAFIVLGLLRAALHYIEQLANHDMAFRILAVIRDRVFKALRRQAPAGLDQQNSGTLVSIITNDIELLEVFYAHTISPVAIVILVSGAMFAFLGSYHPAYALLALVVYLILAIAVPVATARSGRVAGRQQRADLSRLNSILLDGFNGIRECIQFEQKNERKRLLITGGQRLSRSVWQLQKTAWFNGSLSLGAVLLSYAAFWALAVYLLRSGAVQWDGVIVPTVAFMSGFGPVLALSNLANNLLLTFASGERVLQVLDAEAETPEVVGNKVDTFDKIALDKVFFSYKDKPILNGWQLTLKPKEIVGLTGPSGCGKSTPLKLLLRFYDPERGHVRLNGLDLRKVDTASLRCLESYMTQETYLFNDTLLENVRLANLCATDEMVYEACRKAGIHDVICAFPEGYATQAGHLGTRLSAGERQRIGLARAFLHQGAVALFDEPTANLDSLNEGIILKAIRETSSERAVLIVSHRASTLRIADRLVCVNNH